MNDTDQTESDDPIVYDEFRVGDKRGVPWVCHTDETHDGYSVQASVTSYEYERNGETKLNHVPNVVVTDETGRIVSEPHAHDSTNPEKAIENARETVRTVFGRLEE
jgi:hypothetical protein